MASFAALSWHSWQLPSAVTAGFGQRLSGCLCSTVVHLHCQSMVAPPSARCAFYTRLPPQKDLRSQDGPCAGRGAPRENAALWTRGGAPTRVPKPSRSDQFYVPEFAELTRVVLVAQKGH